MKQYSNLLRHVYLLAFTWEPVAKFKNLLGHKKISSTQQLYFKNINNKDQDNSRNEDKTFYAALDFSKFVIKTNQISTSIYKIEIEIVIL